MPIRIELEPGARVRLSRMTGVITDGELLDAYTALIEDPAYDPSLDDLVDTSTVIRVEVTPEGVREVSRVIARMDARNPGTRVAIVSVGGAAFVMARLYTFYREVQGAPATHRVFREMREARAWLGLAPEREE